MQRRILGALALVALVAFAACDDGDDGGGEGGSGAGGTGGGDTGGTGGGDTGGSGGGTGGTGGVGGGTGGVGGGTGGVGGGTGGVGGGTGGTGGNGDCSALDFSGTATEVDVNLWSVDGDTGTANLFAGSCGGAGNETIWAFNAPTDGQLLAQLDTAGSYALYATTACDGAGEIACDATNDVVDAGAVTAGSTIYFVVDGLDATGGAYTLYVLFVPSRGEGETCDPAGEADRCLEGLACDGTQEPAICVVNTAPVLTTVTAAWVGATGQDLRIVLSGTDAEANVDGIAFSLLDAAGAPIAVDWQGDGNPQTEIAYFLDSVEGGVNFVGTLSIGGAGAIDGAVAVRAAALDVGSLASNMIDQTITLQPLRTLGEGCDAVDFTDRCDTGLICKGEPTVCTQGIAPTFTATGYFRTTAGSQIALAGLDPDLDLTSVTVALFDAAGAPFPIDLDGDGTVDSHEVEIDLAGSQAADGTFSTYLDSSGLELDVASVELTLHDGAGLSSATVTELLVDIPRPLDGEACDVTGAFNQCADGSLCALDTQLCRPGTAPAAGRVALFEGATAGDREIVIEVTDVDGDFTTAHLEYLDAAGQPVLVDLDADGVGDVSEEDLAVDDFFSLWVQTSATRWVLRLGYPATPDLAQIAITPTDAITLSGPRATALLTTRPVRAEGDACEMDEGWDTCAQGFICVSGGATSICVDAAAAQQAICNGAPVVTPGVTVAGTTTGGSTVFDPPAACTGSTGSPEVLYALTLNALAPTLRISTDLPGTTLDTVVYLIEGCGGASLDCNDDGAQVVSQYSSDLLLTDVPAGDYFVVVDSYGDAGDFELLVELP